MKKPYVLDPWIRETIPHCTGCGGDHRICNGRHKFRNGVDVLLYRAGRLRAEGGP